MKTAFLYVRVSTDEQADKGYSQRNQDEILRRYCEINKISVKDVFIEDHSAKTFNRPEFSKLLLAIKKKRNIVDLLLFTKWDRFSRNTSDAYQMISTLNKLGVDPQAIEQPMDLEVPENRMMLAVYLAVPQIENDRRSLNVVGGMRRAQKEGRWMGTAPVGYKNKISAGGMKYISPDDTTAPIMRWVFEQIAAGTFTTEQIWKRAREKGLKTSKNNFWTAIRNPVYCGVIKIKAYKKEDVQFSTGQHKPLISEALFYQAQDVLDGKKKKQRTKIEVDENFPLRGFLKCPKCTLNLTASASKGRHNRYFYYHCTSSCGTRYKAETVNNEFLNELRKWKAHPAVEVLFKTMLQEVYGAKAKQKSAELKKVNAEILRLTERKAKARNMFIDNKMDSEDYNDVKRECEISLVQLEAKRAELSIGEINIEPLIAKSINLLSNLDSIYRDADIERKRLLINTIFPEKLTYNGNSYRTERLNEAVKLIYSVGAAFSGSGDMKNAALKIRTASVIPLGLEPRTHTLKVYCSTN